MIAPDPALSAFPLETSHQEPRGSTRPLLPSPVLLAQLQGGPAHPTGTSTGIRGSLGVSASAPDPCVEFGVRRTYLAGHFQTLSSNTHTSSFFRQASPQSSTFSCFWLGRDLGLGGPWEPSDRQTQPQSALCGGWEHQQLLICKRTTATGKSSALGGVRPASCALPLVAGFLQVSSVTQMGLGLLLPGTCKGRAEKQAPRFPTGKTS